MLNNLVAIVTPANPLQLAAATVASELPKVQADHVVEYALTQALPVSDIVFGGGVLVLVIMCHAIFIRLITSAFLKQSRPDRSFGFLWHADLLFAIVVMALLTLHLAEIMLWTAALVFSGIVGDWSRAGYFAANCYTALGEPFSLPHAWRMVPPIIAISGIFTFAWTASVLVDFVSRYNDMRAAILARTRPHPTERKRSP
jgi:hypothetical protein